MYSDWEINNNNLGFTEGNFYWTKTEDGKRYLFRVLEFHRGEYIIKEYLPTKDIKPVNLKNDIILMEMTPQQFVKHYPEYVI